MLVKMLFVMTALAAAGSLHNLQPCRTTWSQAPFLFITTCPHTKISCSSLSTSNLFPNVLHRRSWNRDGLIPGRERALPCMRLRTMSSKMQGRMRAPGFYSATQSSHGSRVRQDGQILLAAAAFRRGLDGNGRDEEMGPVNRTHNSGFYLGHNASRWESAGRKSVADALHSDSSDYPPQPWDKAPGEGADLSVYYRARISYCTRRRARAVSTISAVDMLIQDLPDMHLVHVAGLVVGAHKCLMSGRFLKELSAEWRGEEVGGTHGEEVGAAINLPWSERDKLGEDSAGEGEGEKLRLLCFPQMTKGGMMGDLLVSYDSAVSAARAAEQRVERQEARARDIETRHTPLTHRALLNPLNPNFQPDYKAAWDSLSPDDRKEMMLNRNVKDGREEGEGSSWKREKKAEVGGWKPGGGETGALDLQGKKLERQTQRQVLTLVFQGLISLLDISEEEQRRLRPYIMKEINQSINQGEAKWGRSSVGGEGEGRGRARDDVNRRYGGLGVRRAMRERKS